MFSVAFDQKYKYNTKYTASGARCSLLHECQLNFLHNIIGNTGQSFEILIYRWYSATHISDIQTMNDYETRTRATDTKVILLSSQGLVRKLHKAELS